MAGACPTDLRGRVPAALEASERMQAAARRSSGGHRTGIGAASTAWAGWSRGAAWTRPAILLARTAHSRGRHPAGPGPGFVSSTWRRRAGPLRKPGI